MMIASHEMFEKSHTSVSMSYPLLGQRTREICVSIGDKIPRTFCEFLRRRS